MKLRQTVVSALALILAGCGGGGNSAAPPSGSAPTPAPSPTPAPAPTPTVTTRIFASSEATGRLAFTDGNLEAVGQFIVIGFTTRDGRYIPGFVDAIAAHTALGGAPGANLSGDYADRFKQVIAFDHETGMRLTIDAPANVRMITPLTGMLAPAGSREDKVERQFGVSTGPWALASNPDLGRFDAIAAIASGDPVRVADGERMLAANLRALTLIAGLTTTIDARRFLRPGNIPPRLGDGEPIIIVPGQPGSRTAQCLNAGPDAFIFEIDPLLNLIDCYAQGIGNGYVPPTGLRAQAIAHVISTYAKAIPARLETRTDRARWVLGLNGYLAVLIGQIYNSTSEDVARNALSITTSTIEAETRIYANNIRYNETGLYMPSPDFIYLPSGSETTIPAQFLTNNDVLLSNERFNTSGIDLADTRIRRLEDGPSTNGAVTGVFTLIGSSGESEFTIRARADFKGATYFDYIGLARNGEEKRTRVYIRVY